MSLGVASAVTEKVSELLNKGSPGSTQTRPENPKDPSIYNLTPDQARRLRKTEPCFLSFLFFF